MRFIPVLTVLLIFGNTSASEAEIGNREEFMICDPATGECYPEGGFREDIETTLNPETEGVVEKHSDSNDGDFHAEISFDELQSLAAQGGMEGGIEAPDGHIVPHHVMMVLIASMLFTFLKALVLKQSD